MNKIPNELQPALKTMLRAYGVGWSITTIPGILSILIKTLFLATKKDNRSTTTTTATILQKALFISLPQLLKNSITQNGFPLLLVGSLGGQRLLRYWYSSIIKKKKKVSQRAAIFWSSLITIVIIRRLFPKTKTLDLTFFVLVRALDVFAHRIYVSAKVRQKMPEWILEYGNIFIFMLASTEIIFSWFYEPERLPKSYAKWITNMSGIDTRLLETLRAIRNGNWIYGKDTGLGYLLSDYCAQLGLPRSFGDPIYGRIDCTVIHEGSPYGCEVNALYRFYKGFVKIFPVYLSVHLLPTLFFQTSRFIQTPIQTILRVLLASTRSSTFLGTYIAIIWYSICLVRTRLGHQVFKINQTRLDNTLSPLVGSMLCGLSLLVESKHRRGEMTLYVVPRALFSFTERILSPHQKGRGWEKAAAEIAENLTFATSVMIVLHAVYQDQFMVRPSVRGLLSWILKDELKQEQMKDMSDYYPSGDSTPIDDKDEIQLEITKKESIVL
ncbi:uncharacterized protein BX663DRAFT_498069 [Cokeromyces recurvatus]|uniref:uncharacterized protein n=1 Tax=Cokeromyces recurvatus TaxID=90255 RepID=UPI00222020A8|nr:uncharacterized protein BX663DRAFT_498069 [Cokeromyces recurvatus]KAI7905904.1 hypothetical protein BX663DRAFT_498069 [Cokeromyces recurvatus]